jgi:hypothetical protein
MYEHWKLRQHYEQTHPILDLLEAGIEAWIIFEEDDEQSSDLIS